MRLNLLSVTLILILNTVAYSTEELIDTAKKTEERVDSVKKSETRISGPVTFLLSQATDASQNADNHWMGPLIESIFEFKLSAVENFSLINSDSVAAVLPSHHMLRGPTESEYSTAAKKLGARYIGFQKYEYSKDKSIFYYMEIVSVKDNNVVTSIEREFNVNRFGFEIDEIITQLLKELKIVPQKDLSRFMRLPAVGQDLKILKELGDCIISERYTKNNDSLKVADEYRNICEKDRSMFVAYYRAGLFFNAVGRYADASEALNILFTALPEYPFLYAPLCMAFRKAKKYDDAVRVAVLGNQHGIDDTQLLLQLGLAYEETGKISDAENTFKKLLAGDPNEPHALLYHARRCNIEGNAKEALEYSDRLLKLKKEVGGAYMERGRSLALLSRTEDAINAFTQAISLLPGAVEPYVYLGDLYAARKQYDKAAYNYGKVLQKSPDDVDLYIKAAQAYNQSRDSKKAIAVLRQIESRVPNNGTLQRELGLLELADKDSLKARMHLEACVKSGTEDYRVLSGLGFMYLNSGDYDKAQAIFTRALPQAKDKNEIKLGLAKIAIKKGNVSSAVTFLEEISSTDQKLPDVNRMLGDAYLAKGDKVKALSFYKKERTISKADSSLQSQIASLSYEVGSPPEAKSEYETLVAMCRVPAAVFYRLAVISLKMKIIENARNYLSKAEGLGTADAETYLQIGNGFMDMNSYENAIDAFKDCVGKDPSREAAWLQLISIYKKTGKESDAAEADLKIFALNNNKYKSNLAEAGRLFENKGLKDKARTTYAAFLDKKFVDPDISIRYAGLQYDDKRYQTVIDVLQNVPPTRLMDESLMMMLGDSYCKVNMYEKALKPLSSVLAKSPKNFKAIELCAVANEKTGNSSNAILMYKKYLAVAGKNQDIAYHIAELYEKQKSFSSAMERYQININDYPKDFRNYDHLARLRYDSKNWSGAVAVLQKAVLFQNASQELRGMLARAQSAQGNTSGAIDNFKVYLQTSGGDSSGWLELASLYFDQKDYKNAADAFQKAASLMKSAGPEIYRFLGISYFRAGDLANAVNPIKRAREASKDDAELLDILAQCYRKTKNARDLTSILKEWMQIDKNNYDIRKELAGLLLADQKTDEASLVLEDAVRLKECPTEIYLLLAHLYELKGNSLRWLSNLKAASRCTPKNGELYFQIARYYAAQKRPDQSQIYLEKTVAINSNNAEAHFMLGNSLLASGDYKGACDHFTQAVRIDKNQDTYRAALAEALCKMGKQDDALKIIRVVVSKENPEPAALRLAGLLYKEAGKVDTAKQILENAIMVNKNCGECYNALGDIYFDENDFRNASKNYQSSIDILGYSEPLAVKLAMSYSKTDKADQARQIFETILSKNPQNGEALYRLVHSNIESQKIDLAKRIVNSYSQNKNGWYYLADGEVCEAEQNINAAMMDYSKSIRMIPDASEIQAACGRISLAKKKYSAAVMYFGKAMGGDPENVDLILNMGKAYEGTGDFPTAMELYKEVERRKPDHPEVHYLMARITSREQNHAKAIETLKDGIVQNKKNALLYLALGHEYRMLHMDDDALDSYFKALRLDELKCKEAYRHIGNIYYYSKKDEKKAKKYYEIYIKIGGQDLRVQSLLKKL